MKATTLLLAIAFLVIAFVMAISTLRKDSWRWVITTWSTLAVGITFTLATIYN